MFDALPLSPTLGPLNLPPREGLNLLREMGFQHVQLSATQPGLRPRELDNSARRDLAATLRRLELKCTGFDLWIPTEHFLDAATSERAVDAVFAAIELAADFDRCPLSFTLPPAPGIPGSDSGDESAAEIVEAITQHANTFGVELADHAVPISKWEGTGIGIDPAAWLSIDEDPAAIVTQNATKIVAARVCDLSTSAMRSQIGQEDGRLDVLTYQIALNTAGFTKPVIIDARQWHEPVKGVMQTVEEWERSC